ncbi:hypothetical protein [Herbaspirillum sp. RV1423]|uniref:hypothetical protein n=1 Tax=Herbaspirillum sp. RV1423 TaxID=1443993 RepID=UPI0009DE6DFC|nr:hypothetical protein [Herbaspirillum sp. RV1423]
MRSDLRRNPLRSIGRYWLTMSDASAFMLVKSCVSIAETLRSELSDKARIHVKISGPELAVILLTAAESGWGKGKANQLVLQISEMKNPDATQRARVFNLVRDAMAQLPLTLWSQEKLPARRELLEELTRQLQGIYGDLPMLPNREEIREQEWRAAIMETSKREARDRR